MRAVSIETFHSKVCARSGCDSCEHYNALDDECATMCYGSLSGFVSEDWLTDKDKRLLGWRSPRRTRRRP